MKETKAKEQDIKNDRRVEDEEGHSNNRSWASRNSSSIRVIEKQRHAG